MSTTATKRTLAEAERDAADFRELFAGCYDVWTVAGSIRRRKPEVGDCEHVVIAKVVTRAAGLFGEPHPVNFLWWQADELLASGVIEKHVYQVNRADGTTGERHMWGDTYRGVSYRGHLHEIFCAHPDNYGAILTIRTGPADFSKMLVTRLHATPLRQKDGFLRYERGGDIYPCRTEQAFFQACGVAYTEPEARR